MSSGRIPRSADEIDAGWLEDALAERHPGVRVAGVEVVEAHEATNSHALLQVDYHQAHSAAGAPARLFCKLLPSDPAMRPLVAATGMGRREALFYERLAEDLPLRVPVVHCARHAQGSEGSRGSDEESEEFVLLIEDLASAGCSVPDGSTGVPVDAAARALEDLAHLHTRFEDPARRRADASWVAGPLHDPSYAGRMLRHGLDHHRDRLSDAFAEVAEIYLERADALHALWQEGPTTVIHGDTHIGNVFFDAGRVGFLDWGIISTGTPLRDLSYFLTMALSVPERRAHERDLIGHYLQLRGAAGLDEISFSEAWQTHRIHAAYTVVASCQIVLFPEGVAPARQRFADAFLARAEAAVADLESAAALREALA
jgi:hypothetical protein